MAGTFLCPNTCGFGKIVALELSRKVGNSLPREKGEGNTSTMLVFYKNSTTNLKVSSMLWKKISTLTFENLPRNCHR